MLPKKYSTIQPIIGNVKKKKQNTKKPSHHYIQIKSYKYTYIQSNKIFYTKPSKHSKLFMCKTIYVKQILIIYLYTQIHWIAKNLKKNLKIFVNKTTHDEREIFKNNTFNICPYTPYCRAILHIHIYVSKWARPWQVTLYRLIAIHIRIYNLRRRKMQIIYI